MVTIVIPGALILVTSSINPIWSLTPPLDLALSILGCVLTCLGLILLIATIALFARVGEGTLAPWDPTQKLVVRGVYRNVRNPMISGAFGILLGEAIFSRSLAVMGWFLVFLAGNLVYIPLVEEADMERQFGEEYKRYRENVPRWIPRLGKWQVDCSEFKER